VVGIFRRRTLLALALVGPLVTSVVAAATAGLVEEQRRSAATARDLTTLFGATYGVLEGAEAVQRALGSALSARDTSIRFVGQYRTAEAATRRELATAAALAALVPECSAGVREVGRSFDEASSAADGVIRALRLRDREGAVRAGYEFQAAIALTRDAARALVEAAHDAIPSRVASLAHPGRPGLGATWPLGVAGVTSLAMALVLWAALTRYARREEPRPRWSDAT
jgi:hypothetical protein